ncbi:MAG TPA: nucleoside phosphorylase [Taishania sp.]|nr:nucleoside phosphorylase [Taishania sp.]HNS41620.1 nucleoside phosphorylase [Taishania sp.]
MDYPASELVLDSQNRVYHLGISPENCAHKIILVGDQDRVALVSSFFDTIEFTHQHREFVTHTGTYKGKRITVLSTGIGTDNIDITVNELDALANINLKNRTKKSNHTALELVRIGTCGILQPTIPVHSYILSEAALGLDNVAHFYNVPFSENEIQECTKIEHHLGLPEKVKPYYIEAAKELVEKFSSPATKNGITITSSGFYGPQGRQLNLSTKTTQLNERLTNYASSDLKVVNFEMESSALFALSKALGHKSTTICLGIANRPKLEFSKDYSEPMNALIVYVLERI